MDKLYQILEIKANIEEERARFFLKRELMKAKRSKDRVVAIATNKRKIAK